ncbi:uncharacterized protein N7479_007840 [Penicillium vulpinum]|uniref:Zn(2)-C6 fungal-type domain-containing protein n=1 Tax=Penicillium vulpinum TaxID=29845 RepID=A0A1V6SAL0_9EURO|nr:uncharacterized protein N7479_007840 [Penicillium vulpinum]KAJ5960690.1 hypothetical protein N7479_007840 [Penicillium vulpinum]OQE10800.1 hypothetical protein PENVUL_c003G03468 [Penicillium vulpinum]
MAQASGRSGSSTPASSRAPRALRRKACRKCVEAKTACDLRKPKCKRCRNRNTICEYPAPVNPGSTDNASNQYAAVDVNRLSVTSDAISLRSTRSESLVNSTRNVSYTIADGRTVLDFQKLDLAPMTDAEEIRDRWLRPYISSSTGQEPKQLNAHTIQYLTCVLKSYLRNLINSTAPPFIHSLQRTGTDSPVLCYCFTMVRMWLTRTPGCERLILESMRKEMNEIENNDALQSDFDSLCSFQAYLIYFMTMHFFPATAAVEESDSFDSQAQIKMQEIAFRSAKAGLICRAEQHKTRPSWESWIIASAKRRTLFTMYLFTNVYNTQVGLPNFVAEELRGTMAPESKILWQASDRAVWEREYNRHLSRWEDGMLEISELWKSAATGTDARRKKIERWLQSADEFGMMLFSVCAHIHGC